jgi:hypothetical protein
MKNFDWSTLDRNTVISYILSLKNKLTNKKISISKFHRIISMELKSKLPIKIRKLYDNKVELNDVKIGGQYEYLKDQQGLRSINLFFYYNNKKDYFILDKDILLELAKTISDVVLHEIIHMRQYRRRNFKYLPNYISKSDNYQQKKNQEYLGNPDEIDAYGFNIACDLLDKFDNNQQRIIKYLNKIKHNNTIFSWAMYLEVFGYKHRIIQRLKKRIIKYIPHAKEGRPYRNKDWIWY